MSKYWGRRRKNSSYTRNRSHRWSKIFLLLFLLILFVLFIINSSGSIFSFVENKKLSIDNPASKLVSSGWDAKSKINIVINSKPILVISLDPSDKEITAVSISEETYSNVGLGFGWYRMGSVYELGQLENSPRGGELLRLATSKLLLVPIDYFVNFNKDLSTANYQTVKKEISKVGSFVTPFWLLTHPKYLNEHVDTNLTQKEVLTLFWELKGIRFHEDKFYDLKSDYLEEVVLPDDSKGYVLKTSADNFVSEIFEDHKIKQEDIGVAIVNGTKVSGLASDFARNLEHIGINVIRIDNTETGIEKSSIEVSREFEDSYTLKKLEKILQTKALVNGNLITEDLKVTLGDDFDN